MFEEKDRKAVVSQEYHILRIVRMYRRANNSFIDIWRHCRIEYGSWSPNLPCQTPLLQMIQKYSRPHSIPDHPPNHMAQYPVTNIGTISPNSIHLHLRPSLRHWLPHRRRVFLAQQPSVHSNDSAQRTTSDRLFVDL